MTEKIPWGILGNANIARVCVIPAIQQSRNGVVRALASRSPADAAPVAEKNNIPRVYEGYEKLVQDPDIRAVYIPLPNHLHHPWALKALSAGKHVLCEKPIACTAREAREMVNAADKADRLLMEALMYRFHPRSRLIQQAVAKGRIGRPCLIRAAFCYAMTDKDLGGNRNARLNPDMGGGTLLDVGCYGVSLARWMFESEPEAVQAQAVYHSSGVDLHLAGILRFPDDRLATLEASFISALQQTYTVVGSSGAIELPHDAYIPWEKEAVYWIRGKDQEEGEKRIIPGADEYRLMVEHFSDVVQGNTLPAFSRQDAVNNMKVLDALAEAARTGKTVLV
jgi:predicted dehydrogenase